MSIIIFALVSASPIDPVQQNLGQAALANMSAEKIEQLNNWWGANVPFHERYINWITSVLHGDAGTSLRFGEPVVDVIVSRSSASFALMSIAWVLSGAIGFVAGVASGMKRGTIIDKCVQAYCFLLASTPTFWLALLALVVFSVNLGWFPIGFSAPIGKAASNVSVADLAHHIILPALVLSATGIANIALHTRQKVADVMNSDFVRYARASGESTYSICKNHVLRAVSLPAITLQCASVSEIFGGSVLVEQVFSYPGLGQAAVAAGLGGDAPLLCAIGLVSVCIVYVFNALVNLAYRALDPKMRKNNFVALYKKASSQVAAEAGAEAKTPASAEAGAEITLATATATAKTTTHAATTATTKKRETS